MAKLVYTHEDTELLRCNNATRYPDIGETVTVEGIEYEVTAVYGADNTGTATAILRLPGKRSINYYYAYDTLITTNDEPLPCLRGRTTINGILYYVSYIEPGRVDVELYNFPTTLVSYLLMLHSMSDLQFNQWIESLSFSQFNTWNNTYCSHAEDWTVQDELAGHQCSLNAGTLVYCHAGIWSAYNTDYQASATGNTVAELLNAWEEATEHIRYDLPE